MAAGRVASRPETERSDGPNVDSIQESSCDIDADGKKPAAVTAVRYGIFTLRSSGLHYHRGQSVADASGKGREW